MFVQDPATAKFDGMPTAALRTGLVDLVLPPERGREASRGARVVYLRLGFRGTRKEHAALCEAIRERWNVLFFASAVNVVPPTEVYPANCRLGNLHATWADPRARPAVQLAPNEVLGPGMARLVLE